MTGPAVASDLSTVAGARRVLLRDLDALASQVRAYPGDADLWKPIPGVGNPGGTLALHLAGNLRHFIGTELGKTGYVRDRDAEFARRNLSRAEVLAGIAAARGEVDRALAQLPEAALARPYPLEVGGARLSTGYMLLHLIAHFAYHLGQLDYHRRAVTGAGAVPGMIAAKEIAGGA